MRFYVGTYTSKGAAGIYHCDFDPSTGSFGNLTAAAKAVNPTFVTQDPTGRRLYAVDETDSGQITAFSIDSGSGQLQLLNRQPTNGAGPCHISIDSTGQCALVANYASGSVAAFKLQPDGRLSPPSTFLQHHGNGPDKSRQKGPHAHCILPDPIGRFALSCDLGTDQVLIYQLDPATASLRPNTPPFASVAPGAGPRHIKFHPTGPFAYVITELGNTICAFRYDGSAGTLTPIQTISTLAPNFTGVSYAAELCFHPNQRILYASNRGEQTIAVFSVDPENGRLKFLSRHSCGGKHPRNFTVDPTKQFLIVANQDTNNILSFKIDPTTGALSPATGEIEVPAPVCVLFAK
ncbi:MAG TPA: lactonase family protein [Tepidisphaeraceae bacterium]|nr:lactonase family protein [Tepidisphaeraceae bacterium]